MPKLRKWSVAVASTLLGLALILLAAGLWITSDIPRGRVVLGESENWHDDWFTVTSVDDRTFAIGEPRYWQRNYNYLILGNSRALLFDTGPGVRDITPIVNALTDLPVTIMSSHPHYDHIGNNHRFERVAWVRDPSILSEVHGDRFMPSLRRGFTTRRIPPFDISEWWNPGDEIDLGQRRLRIISVPGHEASSFALLDAERKQIFTGDFIYPGWLVGFAPTSNLDAYRASARHLIGQTRGNETLYGAHSVPEHPSPALPYDALEKLERTLEAVIAGSANPIASLPFRIYTVNEDIQLYVPPY